MDYEKEQIVNNCCSILQCVYNSLEDDKYEIEGEKLKAAIHSLKYLPKVDTKYSNDVFVRAKQIKEDWNNCKNDYEKLQLAKKTREIVFFLDKDYTICSFLSTDEKVKAIFGDFLLGNCIGNSEDTETLLSIFEIPYIIK